jgi:hypothetical protein
MKRSLPRLRISAKASSVESQRPTSKPSSRPGPQATATKHMAMSFRSVVVDSESLAQQLKTRFMQSCCLAKPPKPTNACHRWAQDAIRGETFVPREGDHPACCGCSCKCLLGVGWSGQWFSLGVTIFSLINVFILSFMDPLVDRSKVSALDVVALVCFGVLLVETAFRMYALRGAWFRESVLNSIDAVIIGCTITSIVFFSLPALEQNATRGRVFLSLQAARVFRVVQGFAPLRRLFSTAFRRAEAVADLVGLLALLTAVGGLAFSQIFGAQVRSVPEGVSLPEPRLLFDTFPQAMLTLFVITTGENWPSVMENIQIAGTPTAKALSFLIIIWLFLMNWIILQVFLAVIVEGISEDDSEKVIRQNSTFQGVRLAQNKTIRAALRRHRDALFVAAEVLLALKAWVGMAEQDPVFEGLGGLVAEMDRVQFQRAVRLLSDHPPVQAVHDLRMLLASANPYKSFFEAQTATAVSESKSVAPASQRSIGSLASSSAIAEPVVPVPPSVAPPRSRGPGSWGTASSGSDDESEAESVPAIPRTHAVTKHLRVGSRGSADRLFLKSLNIDPKDKQLTDLLTERVALFRSDFVESWTSGFRSLQRILNTAFEVALEREGVLGRANRAILDADPDADRLLNDKNLTWEAGAEMTTARFGEGEPEKEFWVGIGQTKSGRDRCGGCCSSRSSKKDAAAEEDDDDDDGGRKQGQGGLDLTQPPSSLVPVLTSSVSTAGDSVYSSDSGWLSTRSSLEASRMFGEASCMRCYRAVRGKSCACSTPSCIGTWQLLGAGAMVIIFRLLTLFETDEERSIANELQARQAARDADVNVADMHDIMGVHDAGSEVGSAALEAMDDLQEEPGASALCSAILCCSCNVRKRITLLSVGREAAASKFPVDPDDRALGCLQREHPIRSLAHACMCTTPSRPGHSGRPFGMLMLFIIFLSSVQLAWETEQIRADQSLSTTLRAFDAVFAVLFVGEALLKATAFGFLGANEHSYLRRGWNVLDLIVAVTSVIDAAIDTRSFPENPVTGLPSPWVSLLRLARCLRPFKFLEALPATRRLVNAFFRSIGSILSATGLVGLILVAFAIIGRQFFAGALGACTDASVHFKADCRGVFQDPDSGALNIRRWEHPTASFESLPSAMVALLEVTAMEGWSDLMARAMDVSGRDQGPVEYASAQYSVFFVTFVILTAFIMLQVFTGIVANAVAMERHDFRLTEAQKTLREILHVYAPFRDKKLLKKAKLVALTADSAARVLDDSWRRMYADGVLTGSIAEAETTRAIDEWVEATFDPIERPLTSRPGSTRFLGPTPRGQLEPWSLQTTAISGPDPVFDRPATVGATIHSSQRSLTPHRGRQGANRRHSAIPPSSPRVPFQLPSARDPGDSKPSSLDGAGPSLRSEPMPGAGVAMEVAVNRVMQPEEDSDDSSTQLSSASSHMVEGDVTVPSPVKTAWGTEGGDRTPKVDLSARWESSDGSDDDSSSTSSAELSSLSHVSSHASITLEQPSRQVGVPQMSVKQAIAAVQAPPKTPVVVTAEAAEQEIPPSRTAALIATLPKHLHAGAAHVLLFSRCAMPTDGEVAFARATELKSNGRGLQSLREWRRRQWGFLPGYTFCRGCCCFAGYRPPKGVSWRSVTDSVAEESKPTHRTTRSRALSLLEQSMAQLGQAGSEEERKERLGSISTTGAMGPLPSTARGILLLASDARAQAERLAHEARELSSPETRPPLLQEVFSPGKSSTSSARRSLGATGSPTIVVEGTLESSVKGQLPIPLRYDECCRMRCPKRVCCCVALKPCGGKAVACTQPPMLADCFPLYSRAQTEKCRPCCRGCHSRSILLGSWWERLHTFAVRVVKGSVWFDNIATFLVVANALFMAANHHPTSPGTSEIIDTANLVFIWLFAFELVCRLLAHGFQKPLYADGWLTFDTVIVTAGLALRLVRTSFGVQAARVLRIARLFRVMHLSKRLRVLLDTLASSVPAIMSTTFALVLVLFVFAVIGMQLFGAIGRSRILPPSWVDPGPSISALFNLTLNTSLSAPELFQAEEWAASPAQTPLEGVHRHAHFRDFPTAFLLLFRMATGENWQLIYHDCANRTGDWANVYFFAFLILVQSIVLDFYLAGVLEAFERAYHEQHDIMSFRDVAALRNAFDRYDEHAGSDLAGFIPLWAVDRVLSRFAHLSIRQTASWQAQRMETAMIRWRLHDMAWHPKWWDAAYDHSAPETHTPESARHVATDSADQMTSPNPSVPMVRRPTVAMLGLEEHKGSPLHRTGSISGGLLSSTLSSPPASSAHQKAMDILAAVAEKQDQRRQRIRARTIGNEESSVPTVHEEDEKHQGGVPVPQDTPPHPAAAVEAVGSTSASTTPTTTTSSWSGWCCRSRTHSQSVGPDQPVTAEGGETQHGVGLYGLWAMLSWTNPSPQKAEEHTGLKAWVQDLLQDEERWSDFRQSMRIRAIACEASIRATEMKLARTDAPVATSFHDMSSVMPGWMSSHSPSSAHGRSQDRRISLLDGRSGASTLAGYLADGMEHAISLPEAAMRVSFSTLVQVIALKRVGHAVLTPGDQLAETRRMRALRRLDVNRLLNVFVKTWRVRLAELRAIQDELQELQPAAAEPEPSPAPSKHSGRKTGRNSLALGFAMPSESKRVLFRPQVGPGLVSVSEDD